jgi:hypothetical protein
VLKALLAHTAKLFRLPALAMQSRNGRRTRVSVRVLEQDQAKLDPGFALAANFSDTELVPVRCGCGYTSVYNFQWLRAELKTRGGVDFRCIACGCENWLSTKDCPGLAELLAK